MHYKLKQQIDLMKWKETQEKNREWSKVVHLNDESFKKAKDYCVANGLKVQNWVSKLILDNTL